MKFSLSAFIIAASVAPACLAAGINPPATGKCKKPEVRKEWRTLSKAKQAAWISAVKVGSCLATTR